MDDVFIGSTIKKPISLTDTRAAFQENDNAICRLELCIATPYYNRNVLKVL